MEYTRIKRNKKGNIKTKDVQSNVLVDNTIDVVTLVYSIKVYKGIRQYVII